MAKTVLAVLLTPAPYCYEEQCLIDLASSALVESKVKSWHI